MLSKAIFLDRDGVLNVERGDYTYRTEDFIIEKNTPEALSKLKKAGFLLIVITNQGGINKGLYTREAVWQCHEYLQKECNYILDALYYSPYHSDFTNSLSRKPESLMLEKAIAKFGINPTESWMIGDSERDVIAGKKVGAKTARVCEPSSLTTADLIVENLWDFCKVITD